MLLEILPKKGTDNIIITKDGFRSVFKSDFCLVFDIDYDFDVLDDEELNFVLDDSAECKFKFSLEKDYQDKKITITITGGENDNIFLKGVELNV